MGHVRVGAERLVDREDVEQEQRGVSSGAMCAGVVLVRSAGAALVGVSVSGGARGIVGLGGEVQVDT